MVFGCNHLKFSYSLVEILLKNPLFFIDFDNLLDPRKFSTFLLDHSLKMCSTSDMLLVL